MEFSLPIATTRSTTLTTPKTTVAPFSCGADGNYAIGSCSTNYYICVGGALYPQVLLDLKLLSGNLKL